MNAPALIQTSKDIFLGNISSTTPATGDWLAIGHDIDDQTAYNLTEYMLQTLLSQGYTSVTVGNCLGDPKENWYRTANGTSTNSTTTNSTSTSTSSSATATATAISTDGTCGGTTGYTCVGSPFGNCCSSAGWCGSTAAHCGPGCQSAFAICGTATTTSSAPNATATLSVSTDGACGGTTGETCQGSQWGNCCSQYGYW
jgi:Chitin recognition protein